MGLLVPSQVTMISNLHFVSLIVCCAAKRRKVCGPSGCCGSNHGPQSQAYVI